MYTIEQYNEMGKELYDNLLLRFEPIAIKRLDSRDDIPEGCVQPSKAGEKLPALCQVFAMVRRNRRSFAIFPEDSWCVWPIVSLKQRELDEETYNDLGCKFFLKDRDVSMAHFEKYFPRVDKPVAGLALAPLSTCTFEPDVIVAYCTPSQMRQFLMAAQFMTGDPVAAHFDIVGSCMQAIVPILNGTKDYHVAMPDDGEYERSLCYEDEMMFSVGKNKVEDLMNSFRALKSWGFGHKNLAYDMNLEYPRPEFYNNAMKKWGLKEGPIWEGKSE
jgi:uncharacterized protein (DUF169 family)